MLASVSELAHGAPLARLGPDADADWYPASWLANPDGGVLHDLIGAAARRWGVGPHAAAALAFKGYAWAVAVPVIVGWGLHRRVALPEIGTVRVGIASRLPYVRFDLTDTPVALLPDDPAAGHRQARVLDDPDSLLAAADAALLDDHLAAVVSAWHLATRVGERALWGSAAEAIVQPVLLLPFGSADQRAGAARRVLSAFGDRVRDLVDVVDAAGGPRVQRRTCCLWFTGGSGRGTYCVSCCVTRH
ncbi:MAG: IucA/IucC family C-terminal-domain containing protein [Jiangellaceae bacterium]